MVASLDRLRIKTSSAPAARRVGSSNGKRFERLPFSILEPSRPALCETISAVDSPRLLKLCTTAPYQGLTGRGAQRPKSMRNAWSVDRGGHRLRSAVLRYVNLK